MSYQDAPCSPESARWRQAIKGTHLEASPFRRSEQVYIDAQNALDLPSGFSSGHGASYKGYGQHVQDSAAPGVTPDDLGALSFSSCDEDAEGEVDDSFASEHSFWTTLPADTSTSTVNTVDFDVPPVPLLGRDGRWKGGTPPSKSAAKQDLQKQGQRHEHVPGKDHSLYHSGRIEAPFLWQRAPYQGTRLKRSAADMDGSPVRMHTPFKKARDTQQGLSLQAGSGSISSGSKAKRPRKKASKRPESSNKRESESSKTLRPDDRRHASSELDSVSSGRALSSPASSLGRYKLRKKESVPVLSLTALLTPPPQKLATSSGEDTHGFADYNDDEEDVVRQQVESSRKPTLRNMEDAQARSSEEHREQDIRHEVYGDQSGKYEGEEGEIVEATPETDVRGAFKDEPEEPFQLERSQDRGRRVLPRHWEVHHEFPLLYQRYSVPSSVSPEVLEMLLRRVDFATVDQYFRDTVERALRSHGAFNRSRSILDLYTPRFVKGVGAQKVGMCPVCYEDGKVKFLKTKFSAYNYHLQNFHGISAVTGLPFTPPTSFRVKKRTNVKPKERSNIIQGHCHCCNKFIDMQGPKETEIKVPEIYWWKHAQACHKKGSVPDGVEGFFVEDSWFERVCGVLQLIDGFEGEVRKLMCADR